MRRWKTATALTAVFLSSFLWLGASRAQEMIFPGAEWETATPESQQVDPMLLQEAIDFLDASLPAGGGINEFVIIRNGRMIWEGPESDNVHVVYSMTKSFATTTVGLLIDDGLVSIDSPAKDYVLDLAADYSDVTLRHLATHTSGYRSAEEPYPVVDDDDWMPAEPLAPGPPLFAPGSRYLYSIAGMEQMMNVLTRAAGEPMQDFFQRRIGTPIGLDPTAWDWRDVQTSDGLTVEIGSGGISMSAKDAARLGHLFLNQGNWNGEQLVSNDWVDEATSVQVPVSLLEHPNSYSLPLGGVYGYGWWVNGIGADGKRLYPGATNGTYAALGAYQNNTFIIPEWNMVITREGVGWPRTAPGAWSNFLGLVGFAVGRPSGELDLEPASTYTIFDTDADSVFDDQGDSVINLESQQGAYVGELDFSTNGRMARLVTKFDLPGRSDAAGYLKTARLRFFLQRISGNPAGPVSLFHGVTDNDVDPQVSDYEDTSYHDTMLDLVQATDVIGEYYELDVTDLVLADYVSDGDSPLSAFRLQVDGAIFVEDNQSNYYRFTMPGASENQPQLVLTFVPEPSAGALLLLGVVGILCGIRSFFSVEMN